MASYPYPACLPTHPTIDTWSSNVVLSGGVMPSNNTLDALSKFCYGMDGYGLRSLLPVVNCLVPDNLTAALSPIFWDYGNMLWTNHNFVAGDLTINGLVGNGSSKYLDTGVTPSSFMATGDACLVAYNVIDGNTAGGMWGAAASIGRLRMGFDTASLGNYGCAYADVNTYGAGNNTAWKKGYLSHNKTSASQRNLYWANSTNTHASIASNTNTDAGGTNSAPNNVAYAFCSNEGFATAFTSQRLSFLAMGHGLTAAQSSNLYNLVQKMRTQLGGGYI